MSDERLVDFVNECQAAVGAVLTDASAAPEWAARLVGRASGLGPFARALAARVVIDMAMRSMLSRPVTERLIEASLGERRMTAPATGDSDHPAVRRALALIRQHHADPCLTTGWLAVRLRMSRSHLSRLLVRHTGMGFVQHLHAVRVAHAQEVLRSTPIPIKAVAAEVGYRHVSALSRHFREIARSTPAQFRKAG